jgi:clan AA aspartic protease (TIGR02281 family)
LSHLVDGDTIEDAINIVLSTLMQVSKKAHSAPDRKILAAVLIYIATGCAGSSAQQTGHGVTYYGQSASGASPTTRSLPSSSPASSVGSNDDSPQASGPQQTKIYFTREAGSNHMLVNAEINNRPLIMMFDTGAAACFIGKNQLAELGIKAPSGPAHGLAHGIGSTGGVSAWGIRATIKVGNLVRQNCPMGVTDELSMHPLLGQSFFGGYTYSIDQGANCITLRRTGVNTSTASAPSRQYVVPFVREGNELVVTATINGHPYPMYLDTGASTTLFSQSDLQKLGITLPDEAPVTRVSGIAGTTTARILAINHMQLGPVDRSDAQVMVIEQSAIHKPLLGQPFFEGWELQVDNATQQILFTRR